VNLHGIVSGAIGSVNPFVRAELMRSAGYTTNPDGSRTPTYVTIHNGPVQVQALSTDDLKQIEGLNIQGAKNGVYLNGTWNGVVRSLRQGGDLLKFGGQTWLVVTVLENWPDWSKLAVVLQGDK
jgi:hypothetical protein